MARNVITEILDDIDGSKNAEEVRFGLHGTEYSIDLSKKNRAALEKALEPYIEAGSKVPTRSAGGRRAATTSAKAGRNDLAAVREWAKGQGLEVSDRGRVSASVLNQYDNR